MAFHDMFYATQNREATRGTVTIYEYERGLQYVRGLFQKVLGPGRYRIYPLTHRRIVVVDVRRATVQVVNQKLMTADHVTVTINLVVDYQVVDATAALHQVNDFRGQLYEDVQLAARNVIGGTTVDALLAERAKLNDAILEAVKPLAETYGTTVLSAGIKDVILVPKVRNMLMKEAETKRLAQAALIGAREEVAALRALANAARIAEQHPQLMHMRELETVRAFAENPGNTVVFGVEKAVAVRGSTATPVENQDDES